jgi:hypothetical protein
VASGPKKPRTLTFTYEKSKDFSQRYIDGATARPLPSGNVYLAFFMERGHEFESVTNEVDEAGNIGKEVTREIDEGVLRELQFALIASPATAKRLCTLLTDAAEKAEAVAEIARKSHNEKDKSSAKK